MAKFSAAGLRLDEEESSRRQKRQRTDSHTLREEIAEAEEEDVDGVYEQEFVAEKENEEFREECGVDDDNLGFHGDYGEEEDSEDDHEEEEDDDDDIEFYEYVGEDEDGALLREEDDEEIVENYAEEVQDDEELQDEQEEEREDEGDNNGSVLVTISDQDVLDCTICYKPLIIPVFQCRNGHVACPFCCHKLNNICACCRYPMDYRSRAMEKVIECAQAKCKNAKYGCKETMNYSKKQEHEKTCFYEPCSCPISDCNFIGSSSQLYQHFNIKHKNSGVRFSYNTLLHITLKADEKSFILQEEKDNVLFILQNSVVEGFGNLLTVNCISSKSDELLLDYDIQARDSSRLHCLKFQSITASTQKLDDMPSPTRYLLVPWDFFGYSGHLGLDICIWKPLTSTVRVSRRSY